VVPSDPQVTSHPVSKLHKGRGRSRDPAPSSDDDQDAGIGGSALGVACSPKRAARKQKRESPASVEDLGHPDSLSRPKTMRHQDSREGSGDSEEGATSSRPRAANAASANNLRGSTTEEAPASLIAIHVTPLKRKSSLARRRTANSPLRRRLQAFSQ
jgi:hypothetical protein